MSPPGGKDVRQHQNPTRADHMTIAWKLSRFDWDGPWGLEAFEDCDFVNLFRRWGAQFERQTWAEVFQGSGSKKTGNINHPIKIASLSAKAKKRLVEIKSDDADQVYSFSVKSNVRLYGLRDSRAFQVLWYDPWHDDQAFGVCPSVKGHT